MQQIIRDIFTKQSPLSSAQFEAAYRSHPDVKIESLRFTNNLKGTGHLRLRPWVKSGLVVKAGKFYGKQHYKLKGDMDEVCSFTN